MVDGISPREASDRLTVFQAKFDELWNKYQTYSGGEALFGLTVTEYPELQQIRKELNLLQKLYSLYNEVLEKVNGYNDIAWVEIDLEKINNDLMEFQNKWVWMSSQSWQNLRGLCGYHPPSNEIWGITAVLEWRLMMNFLTCTKTSLGVILVLMKSVCDTDKYLYKINTVWTCKKKHSPSFLRIVGTLKTFTYVLP